MVPKPPRSTLIPYTTLFGSLDLGHPLHPLTEVGELVPVEQDPRHGEIGADGLRRRGPAQRVGRRAHLAGGVFGRRQDRKSTRLNSSHATISYAGFCLR